MQPEDQCVWYLIKLPDDRFAVQYAGDEPDRIFPADISGCSPVNCRLTGPDDEMMTIIDNLHREVEYQREEDASQSLPEPQSHEQVASAIGVSSVAPATELFT